MVVNMTPGAVAAASLATGVAMYLDASLHISKEISSIRNRSKSAKSFQNTINKNGISLWPFFSEQAGKLADVECIWSRSGCYTWKETHLKARQYAQFLDSQALEPGQTYAIYLQNGPEFVFALLAGHLTANIPALINYNLASDSLFHCLKISKAKMLIVDDDDACVARVQEVRELLGKELGVKVVILDSNTKDRIASLDPIQPNAERWKANNSKTPISLIFTSGSTGRPKAVGNALVGAWALGEYRANSFGLKSGQNGDRWYICMPMYHGTALSTALNCLLCGMTLCLGRKFSASRFWTDIRDSRATAFVYVGETARYLLNSLPQSTDKEHSVRLMFGNGLRPDVWERFTERFAIDTVIETFNSTEGIFALLNVSRGPYLAGAVGHHGALARFALRNTFVPVEFDYDTGDIVRDPKTGFARRAPYEVGGEIIVKIPNEETFVGYWDDKEATQKKFERDVFAKGDLYYKTGDALRRTADGRWYFMDRLGDTFRWKSENVATAEVAEVLGQFPGIVEATVYGVKVQGHEGRAGCAALYIQPEQRASFDWAGFQAHCTSKLPPYAVPIFLRILSDLTSMHNNKQNKLPLKEDGVDLGKIHKAAMATGKQPDKILWRPEALNHRTMLGSKVPTGFVELTSDYKGTLDQVISKL